MSGYALLIQTPSLCVMIKKERLSDLKEVKSRKLDPVMSNAKNVMSSNSAEDINVVINEITAGVRVCNMILGDESAGVDSMENVSNAKKILRDAVADANEQV